MGDNEGVPPPAEEGREEKGQKEEERQPHMIAITRFALASLAVAGAMTCATVGAMPAMAATAQGNITYDGNIIGRFDGDQSDEQGRVSVTVELGTEHVVREAPKASVPEGNRRQVALDPQGGELGDGNDGTWSVTRAIRAEDVRFTRWDTQADGKGESHLPGDRIVPTQDMTLYAQWDAPVSITRDPLPSATLDGHELEGWFTQPDGGQLVGRGGEVPGAEWDNVRLEARYAHWVPARSGMTENNRPSPSQELAQTGAVPDNAIPILLLAVTMVASGAAFVRLHRRL